MLLISTFVLGVLAGAGIGLCITATLTAGSRADAWNNGYKAGALAERESLGWGWPPLKDSALEILCRAAEENPEVASD